MIKIEAVKDFDMYSVGLFMRMFPNKTVKAALKESEAESIRERCFPNHIVVYYVLALSMFMKASYREVMRNLLEGAQSLRGKLRLIKAPNKSGISKARRRVGYKPFEILYNNLRNRMKLAG
ncbi:MAG: transposase domain-containing protein [Cyanobacteria bacterium TGS_CYA1]|nr:transposase domain-containing protein [Cyanobacteria bacterium TGS_CYA1]